MTNSTASPAQPERTKRSKVLYGARSIIDVFNNLSIQLKASAASVLLLICLLGLGANAYLTSTRSAAGLRILTNELTPKQQAFAQVKDDVFTTHVKIFRYISWGSNGVSDKLLKPLHAEIIGDLDSLSSRIAAIAQRQDLSSQERATMQGLLAKWAISKSHAMDTIDVGQHDSTLAAPMATMMLGETDDSFEAVNADLQKLSLAVSATAGNTSNQLYFDAERTKSVIILVTLVGFLISSIVVVIVGRSIVRPIESVTDVMQRLSGGEVDVTIDHQDRRDEIGRMVDAIEVFRKNIIEKHEMEQKLTAELGRSVEEMRALAEVGQTVNSTLDLETVLSVIVSKATQLSGTEAGAIYVFSEASLEHQLRATYGMTQSLIDALRDQHAEISNTVALAIERRQPMQTPDLRAERPSVARDIMLEAGYLARLIVPLLAADRIVGALVVRQKAPGEFPKNTITLLQTFAAQSVLAIQNARLFSEIKEARVIAEEATKAKADFLANMSHEIRTPMNAVIGLAHLCLKSDLTAKQRDYVGKIHNAGTSLLSIINDILDFSKIEAGKLDVENVTFEIDALMTNVSTVVAQKIQDKGLELLFDVSSNIPPALLGDPLRLGQVLINLLGNAAKFTERGEIRLTCQLLELGGGKAKLQFSVKDTGVGMTKEQASRLFQAFSQADTSTSRKYGGTGLGLAISKRLVELMDGAIWLNSEPGVGSTFSFTGWFGLSETIGRKAVPMRLGSLKVLVVDDNASAREILDEQLRSIGAEIEQVASGMEAIDAVRRADAGHPFDVILLDWRMPKLDGIETARRIRADRSLKSAPAIIIITAFGREEVRGEAELAGVNGFLIKPVNQSTLIDALAEIFAPEQIEDVRDTIETTSYDLKGLRVLLAEDNAINQQIAVELLEGVGVSVDVANNGKEVVGKLLATTDIAYDLVLMDLQMPEMDGYQATARIRAEPRLANLPIVAMTAHAMAEERDRCLAAGMRGHITKPIDPELLYRTLMKFHRPGVAAEVSAERANRPASSDAQLEIAGLDAVDGLRRVAGNVKLYRSLLRQFAEQQAEAVSEIRASVERQDFVLAERLMHTLKGVSGNLGAKTTNGLAAELEKSLRDRDLRSLDAGLPNLAIELARITEAIRIALASDTGDAQPSAIVSDPTEAVTLLKHLKQLLAEDDGAALDYLLETRERLVGILSDADLDSLEKSVRDFDFTAALECLAGTAQRHQFSLE